MTCWCVGTGSALYILADLTEINRLSQSEATLTLTVKNERPRRAEPLSRGEWIQGGTRIDFLQQKSCKEKQDE